MLGPRDAIVTGVAILLCSITFDQGVHLSIVSL